MVCGDAALARATDSPLGRGNRVPGALAVGVGLWLVVANPSCFAIMVTDCRVLSVKLSSRLQLVDCSVLKRFWKGTRKGPSLFKFYSGHVIPTSMELLGRGTQLEGSPVHLAGPTMATARTPMQGK